MKNNLIVFGQPCLGDAEEQGVLAVMRSKWLGSGAQVGEFERRFSEYRGVDHAVAVNSCTSALHLSLIAANIGPGDEVITTALTFYATVNAILYCGATPVLADVDTMSMNIDPKDVAEKITAKTRAILPVHFAGRICDMAELCDLADRHNLVIIEDCAHAIEAELDGKAAGTFGDFGCFSFYPSKNITCGEGGMILTQNSAAAARLRSLAHSGRAKDIWARHNSAGISDRQVTEVGYKYNLTDLQAAIGLVQLADISQKAANRRKLWQTYLDSFADLPITLPAKVSPRQKHAHHLFTVLIEKDVAGLSRDDAALGLKQLGIGTGVHYPCMAEQRFYRDKFSWRSTDYPNATKIGQTTLSLPLSGCLSGADVARIVEGVHKVVRQ